MDFATTRRSWNGLVAQVDCRSLYGTASKYPRPLVSGETKSLFRFTEALHDAAVHPSDESSKAFALWQARCELFGSQDVARYAQAIVDANDDPREQRNDAFESLLQAMKADLKAE
jgi:hypothetical protein